MTIAQTFIMKKEPNQETGPNILSLDELCQHTAADDNGSSRACQKEMFKFTWGLPCIIVINSLLQAAPVCWAQIGICVGLVFMRRIQFHYCQSLRSQARVFSPPLSKNTTLIPQWVSPTPFPNTLKNCHGFLQLYRWRVTENKYLAKSDFQWTLIK